MPLNPTEVFELHVRFVAARGLREVLSMGTMSPYIVISGNLVGVRVAPCALPLRGAGAEG